LNFVKYTTSDILRIHVYKLPILCYFSVVNKVQYIAPKSIGAVPQLCGFPPLRTGFDPRSVIMGFVVDTKAVGRIFSKYLNFPYQLSPLKRFIFINRPIIEGT
jgi:hypothetical protein